MFFKKIKRDILKLNYNFLQFFKFYNEEDEIFIEFKNSRREVIEDFKFFIIGQNKPINVSKDSKLSILDYFSIKDYIKIRFIPFEYDINQKILYAFLFFICEKDNCNNIVTYCKRRKSQNLCLFHCDLQKPCPPLPKDCFYKKEYIEFNFLLDNYIKLAIDKIHNNLIAIENFPTISKKKNLDSILVDFYNKFNHGEKDLVNQKIRICSTLGSFKIKYDNEKSFIISYNNHPLRNCRSIRSENSNFLQIINPLFNSARRNHLSPIKNKNIHRLYYEQQYFPQIFLRNENYKEFFDRVNYSEELFKKDPDKLHQPIARNLFNKLSECHLLNNNKKELSIIDLGCGSGNLIYNLIKILSKKVPHLKIKLMLVEIDDRKLIEAKNKLRNAYKSCLEAPINTICCSLFELTDIDYCDLTLISQVFDLYIDFLPKVRDLNKIDIENKDLYEFFHNIIFFLENFQEMDTKLYNDYEREFIRNYSGIIRNTLNRVIAFSDHIFIFDHFFKKNNLDKLLRNEKIKISNEKVDFLLAKLGIKFTHIIKDENLY